MPKLEHKEINIMFDSLTQTEVDTFYGEIMEDMGRTDVVLGKQAESVAEETETETETEAAQPKPSASTTPTTSVTIVAANAGEPQPFLGVAFVCLAAFFCFFFQDFSGDIVGSCLGFLWFNAPPAKIFMGDTGSLSLGGSLGAVSVISKHEIVLGIIGGLFVLETASVIIQVISFKLTGKRVFMMAPLHHHFEKKGWAESTVVIRFWIISIILAMIGLATLKLR